MPCFVGIGSGDGVSTVFDIPFPCFCTTISCYLRTKLVNIYYILYDIVFIYNYYCIITRYYYSMLFTAQSLPLRISFLIHPILALPGHPHHFNPFPRFTLVSQYYE